MRDDWSTPTTDELDFARRFSEPADPLPGPRPPANDEIDPLFGLTVADLRILDGFFYELALEAAEDPRPPTPEEQDSIDNLRKRFERLQRMTPEEVEAERQRILAMERRLGMR